MKSQTYEQDFLCWIEEQSALFKFGKLSDLDYDNIFVELNNLVVEQKVALQSLLRNIIIHLLKLELSPLSLRPVLIEEVTEFRDQAQTRIEETPSLKHYSAELFAKTWPQAKRAAEKSFEAYRENVFIPAENPYSLEQTSS